MRSFSPEISLVIRLSVLFVCLGLTPRFSVWLQLSPRPHPWLITFLGTPPSMTSTWLKMFSSAVVIIKHQSITLPTAITAP